MEEIILSQLQNEVVTNNVTMKVKDEIYKIKHMLSQEVNTIKRNYLTFLFITVHYF